jgi:hypothetical protein
MATLSVETVEALNRLLEDTRASVECEIALASGAADFLEREAFTTMGREDVEACCALHELLERCLVPVVRGVSDASAAILGAEDYDDRLRAFAEYQHTVGQRAQRLAGDVLDRETQIILQRITASHVWHATWSAQRAGEFAATRALDFTRGGGQGLLGMAALHPLSGGRTLPLSPQEPTDGTSRTIQGQVRGRPADDGHAGAPADGAGSEASDD